MGSRGHSFNASYQCAENVEVAARFILTEHLGSSGSPDDDFNLFFIDLILHAR
jgi:hypothetical protein